MGHMTMSDEPTANYKPTAPLISTDQFSMFQLTVLVSRPVHSHRSHSVISRSNKQLISKKKLKQTHQTAN